MLTPAALADADQQRVVERVCLHDGVVRAGDRVAVARVLESLCECDGQAAVFRDGVEAGGLAVLAFEMLAKLRVVEAERLVYGCLRTQRRAPDGDLAYRERSTRRPDNHDLQARQGIRPDTGSVHRRDLSPATDGT
jgi:hypothetical protein